MLPHGRGSIQGLVFVLCCYARGAHDKYVMGEVYDKPLSGLKEFGVGVCYAWVLVLSR